MTEAELIDRARQGDGDAFGELVTRYQTSVYRTALAALRSPEEAEDVAQEAFVAAYQKLDGFRGDSSFKTWLLTITWRRALDRRRQVGEWLRRFVTSDDPEPPLPPTPAATHEDVLVTREMQEQVRRLVQTLPAKFRDALLLSASGDHTFDEIAAILKIPAGTAKWRAMEGRRQLKQKLVRLGYRHGR